MTFYNNYNDNYLDWGKSETNSITSPKTLLNLGKCASSKFPKNGKQNKTLIHQINQLIKPLKQH
ncbi:hypothetical protein DERF_000729 [Dermatophagoides farinae]|uniref:Uncharacterized protein n=1 Tax=Dermatophagoides farinae TaxID=6954 RepID=A0A922I9H2_DERFA|nr:hypothetical protein DERF_000729 [Dermatophagoides farinae]